MMRVLSYCVLIALSTAPAASSLAQAVERVLPPGKQIADFRDARDLAVDDQGVLYVLDAETSTVTRISGGRQERQALTATDATGDAFAEPVDIDPTNGLSLIVADAGREELQWYSRSFRLLETRILTPSNGRQSVQSGYGESGWTATGARGTPMAVVSTVSGEVFAVDAVDGVMYRWDSSGRFGGIMGAEGEGRLIDPVDLAAANELVYTADQGRRSVVVYDRFGSFVRLIARKQAADIRAVSVHQDELFLVLPDRILIYSLRGRLLHRWSVELDEPLVDCVRTNDGLYLLTQTKLFQLSHP